MVIDMNEYTDNCIDDTRTIDEEIGEFHDSFRHFVNRLNRGSLIVTGNSSLAEKFQVEIYNQAFMAYLRGAPINNFGNWLPEIVLQCFAKWPKPKSYGRMMPVYSVDIMEALRKTGEHKSTNNFRSWLKKIWFGVFRKPSFAD
jgi:hypothetical protein